MMLEPYREALRHFLPGLGEDLDAIPLARLESPDSPAIGLFKQAGGPKLLVPREDSGLGATAVEAVRVQTAIGAVSPSLAVATCMHHFSTASLIEVARTLDSAEWLLLDAIAEQNLLVASGFAEGVSGTGVLAPAMSARFEDGRYLLNGSKKPCSLSKSMDLITVSLLLDEGDGPELGIAVVSGRAPGVTVTPFWRAPVLAGAESEAVTLTDVEIAPRQLARLGPPGAAATEAVQQAGFLWFELLVSASYLGMTARLLEQVLSAGRGTEIDRIRLAARLRAALLSLEAVAARLDADGPAETLLGDALLCRFAAQETAAAVAAAAVELQGGMAFILDDPVTHYFGASAHCLSFHPPSLNRAAGPLVDWLAGKPLTIA